MSEIPFLDVTRCNQCRRCVDVCKAGALVFRDDAVSFSSRECDWCTECESVCPTGAVSCAFEIVHEDPRA